MKLYVKSLPLISLIVSFIFIYASILAEGSTPSIQILSPQNEIYYKKYVSLNFTSEGASTFNYSLDDNGNEPIEENIEVENGQHTIIVYANDGNGTIVSSDKALFFYCKGDLTGKTTWVPNGKVDIKDIATVAIRFGSIEGDRRYDARADLTGPDGIPEGKIDIRDIAFVAIQFGEMCFDVPPSPVSIIVKYEDGNPANASVKVYDSDDNWLASGSTDENGNYTINLLPGNYSAVATDEFGVNGSSEFTVLNEPINVTITLPIVTTCIDGDNDGYDVCNEFGDPIPGCDDPCDCDDSDPDMFPGNTEVCDNKDNDCDGSVDGINQSCGSGDCLGTETCTDGVWGDCSSDGNSCDDGLFCTDPDYCTAGVCGGSDKDCSTNDITGIATCDNDPDLNPFTWDFREAFTSVCDEDLDVCTSGDETINHTCSIDPCGAECEINDDCDPTNCTHLDGCDGGKYKDYSDVENTCEADCTCTANSCGPYSETGTDADEDGWDVECEDCDDDPAACGANCYPGNTEICDDGYDNDCDDATDEWSDCSCPGSKYKVTVHVEDGNGDPLSEIPVYIIDANTLERVTDTRITDSEGNYYACLSNGEYIARAQDPIDPSYWHSQYFIVNNGPVTVTIEINV